MCRWIFAFYGPTHHHGQLNAATHADLGRLFGVADLEALDHIGRMIRTGQSVDRDGNDVYLAPRRAAATSRSCSWPGTRTGSSSPRRRCGRCAGCRTPTDPDLYRRVVLPDYAHLDGFIGRNAAVDVFPHILEHLEATPALNVACADGGAAAARGPRVVARSMIVARSRLRSRTVCAIAALNAFHGPRVVVDQLVDAPAERVRRRVGERLDRDAVVARPFSCWVYIVQQHAVEVLVEEDGGGAVQRHRVERVDHPPSGVRDLDGACGSRRSPGARRTACACARTGTTRPAARRRCTRGRAGAGPDPRRTCAARPRRRG